jgi:hypothetical protein
MASKVYVSGPMTGYPEFNYPAFHEASAALREYGYEVVSPAEIDAESGLLAGTSLWEDFIRHDVRILTYCDGIVLLDGWHKSRGARLEHHIALTLNMDVLTLAEALA